MNTGNWLMERILMDGGLLSAWIQIKFSKVTELRVNWLLLPNDNNTSLCQYMALIGVICDKYLAIKSGLIYYVVRDYLNS